MNYNNKKTQNELQKYYRLKTRSIPNIINKLEVINYEMQGVGAQEYNDMPGPTGCKKTSYKLEKLIQEKTELEERLKVNQVFVKYMDEALEKLNKIDKDILIECFAKEKYERLCSLELCIKLNISASTFYRRKKEILNEFGKDLLGI
ncbi:hypothetical protein BH721_01420 [Clostridium baratii]|uniref:hypothetical protein n=1 Tax=Clostridium baratii TaxID=1561 RepID=UPI0009A2E01E|nr:hypothetical protein [Clostridium baratii]OPF51534.1 hypothetical protein A1M12_03055 [Clostridium baratii]OPF55395.1 hypothetical protein BH721_01420 [Clostridium baratii]OPF57678.1 hypothetical protein BH724_08675 [Clostridium baratii]OPF60224.1 hypothetical protein BH725_06505 [Clostridium baratii]